MGIRKGWRYHQCKKLITSAKIWGLVGSAEILLEVWEPSYAHYIAYIGPLLLIGLIFIFWESSKILKDLHDPQKEYQQRETMEKTLTRSKVAMIIIKIAMMIIGVDCIVRFFFRHRFNLIKRKDLCLTNPFFIVNFYSKKDRKT